MSAHRARTRIRTGRPAHGSRQRSRSRSRIRSKELLQPADHASDGALAQARAERAVGQMVAGEERQAGRSCELGPTNRVRETGESIAGDADAHGHAERMLRYLDCASACTGSSRHIFEYSAFFSSSETPPFGMHR